MTSNTNANQCLVTRNPNQAPNIYTYIELTHAPILDPYNNTKQKRPLPYGRDQSRRSMTLVLGVLYEIAYGFVVIPCVQVIPIVCRVSFQYLDGLALVVDIPRAIAPKPI